MLEWLLSGPVDGSLSELGASFLELLEKYLLGKKQEPQLMGTLGGRISARAPLVHVLPFAALRLS